MSGDQLVILVFVLVALSVFTGASSSYSGNPLIWIPSLVINIPIALVSAVAGAGSWFIAPLFFIAILAFAGFLDNAVGEAVLYLALFSVVVMAIGA